MYSTNIFFITILSLLVRREKYTVFNRLFERSETEDLSSHSRHVECNGLSAGVLEALFFLDLMSYNFTRFAFKLDDTLIRYETPYNKELSKF